MTGLRLGIDSGGTFTDFVLYNPDDRSLSFGKRLSTPEDPSVAVIQGTQELLQRQRIGIHSLSEIMHATTVVGNMIIERRGAKLGMIATEGYRDVLEIGHEQRYDLYDLFIKRAEPLVPRYLAQVVSERVDSEGNVLRPLRLEEVDRIASSFRKEDVEAVAVVLMHAYRNPAHEQAIREHLKARFPDCSISISSEIAPEVREHPRASTTVANAYVQPAIERYVAEAERRLKDLGFRGVLYLMLSGGGLTSVGVARKVPVRLVESGPAAGVSAAAFYGALVGESDLTSFDMGGTTAKICLISGGRPSKTTEMEVAREDRFKKGSGLIVKIPTVELSEIGAGGGSIARVDQMGLLKVGPRSAGASPGPACYGRGGAEPTVTDADLVLGYLDPDYFMGGEMPVNQEAARAAIHERIAKPLGLDLLRAAAGIYEVVNENMATAARLHAAEKGADLRRHALLAFGGAGPVHAFRLAKLLHISRVICPLGAGVSSALGLLAAPRSFDFSQSHIDQLSSLDWASLGAMYEEMEAQAERVLASAGVAREQISLTRFADMRYAGQGFEITVQIPEAVLRERDGEQLVNLFNQAYERLFGNHLSDVPVEALTWRLTASETFEPLQVRFMSPAAPAYGQGLKGKRPIYLQEEGRLVQVPVYDRYSLTPGTSITGPAIVEEKETTVLVGPDARASIDEHLNLIMDVVGR